MSATPSNNLGDERGIGWTSAGGGEEGTMGDFYRIDE